MAASRLRALPGTDYMPGAAGIELDVVVADGGRADTHTLRMAAAGDAQPTDVAGACPVEMAAIAAAFPFHARAPYCAQAGLPGTAGRCVAACCGAVGAGAPVLPPAAGALEATPIRDA